MVHQRKKKPQKNKGNLVVEGLNNPCAKDNKGRRVCIGVTNGSMKSKSLYERSGLAKQTKNKAGRMGREIYT